MKLPCVRFGWIALTATLLMLGACERRDAVPATPATSPAATDASAANATVTPQSGNLPASSTAGPADGATAIGGMVTNQGTGKAGAGNTSAPTGGDGAASAPSPAASK